MNYPCSLCGSRDWPSENTTCPLCRAEPEEAPPLRHKGVGEGDEGLPDAPDNDDTPDTHE